MTIQSSSHTDSKNSMTNTSFNKQHSNNPRFMALQVLNRFDSELLPIDGIIQEVCPETTLSDSSKDRSLFHAIVIGVLRWRYQIDWIIGRFSKIHVHQLDPEVLNILRIAIFQIEWMDRIPDSAAVHTAVELTKSIDAPWITRFVNGVLRSIIRERQKNALTDFKKQTAKEIALKHAFPRWLVKKWIREFGIDQTEKKCIAHNAIPMICIRVNTLKTTQQDVFNCLMPIVSDIQTCKWAPHGIRFQKPSIPIPSMTSFQNGWFQVQDEASQLAVLLLAPRPGNDVLDACAGRGGKTAYLAQQMNNTGYIYAVDRSEKKLLLLSSEMERLGVSIVQTSQHAWEDNSSHIPQFHCIMVDAPCSGLGVIRRHPDIKWTRKLDDLQRHQANQLSILSSVAPLLKPTGKMVYAVCSTEFEENEQVVHKFLSDHNDFFIDQALDNVPVAIKELIDENGFLKTEPSEHHTDGFFAVRFQRR